MDVREFWRRTAPRRIARVLVAAIVGALVAVVWYQVSVQPGAAVLKAVFEAKPEVTPPAGFSSIRSSVKVGPALTIASPGAPAAKLVMYSPTQREGPLPVVLWIHGGGFISSSPETVADFAVMLAASGYTVASLDYSLAPQAQHPTPVRQANGALAFLKAHAADYGGDPTRLAVGGDSAGAQIASELAAVQTNPLVARADRITPAAKDGLRAVVLYCGLYDLTTVGSTGFPGLRTYLWAYTGHRDWLSAPNVGAISTTKNVTNNYPPTFLTVGDKDPFDGQGHKLVEALQAKNVVTKTLFWDGTGKGLNHEYQFNYSTSAARKSFAETVTFLGERLSS
jgi:acetyl esterase/lipase